MSATLRAYVAKHSKLKGSARAVLEAIAHYARDDGGGAYPSISTLARESRASESSVHRAIREAQLAGELQVDRCRGPNGTNLYRINLESMGSSAVPLRTGPIDCGDVKALMTPPVNLTPKGSSLRGAQHSSTRFYLRESERPNLHRFQTGCRSRLLLRSKI